MNPPAQSVENARGFVKWISESGKNQTARNVSAAETVSKRVRNMRLKDIKVIKKESTGISLQVDSYFLKS